MPDRTTSRRQARPSKAHRPPPPTALRATMFESIELAAWTGLLAGLVEVATAVALRIGQHGVTLQTIRTNRHFAWMVPLSDLVLFLAGGAILALMARRSAIVGRLSAYLIGFAGAMAVLLAVEGLHPAARLVLAAGVAVRMGGSATDRRGGFRKVVRRSLPALAGAATLLVIVQAGLEARRAAAALPPARPGAPNVILITMDTVRASSLSLYGYERPTSPNLERLARRGVTFDEARSTAPWTLPSHASLFTGRWPHELSTKADRPLDSAHPTLAEYFARHGYATGGFVANTYYCNSWYGLDRGFARYEDFDANDDVTPIEVIRSSELGGRLVGALDAAGLAIPGARPLRKDAARINRDALGWIDAQAGRPFFAFLNYYDAHGPYQLPAGVPRRFSAQAAADDPEGTLRAFKDLGRGTTDPKHAHEVTRKAATLMRDSYDDCIAYLDVQAGEFCDDLRRRGLLENTVVVITSDHGEHFGEHHLFGHGVSLYREEVHVPLIIRGPRGVPAGTRVAEPSSLRDLAATIVELAGLDRGSPFPGESLARSWRGDPSHAPILSEVEHQRKFAPSSHIPASLGEVRSVVGADCVYIRNADGREELYDLDEPAELHNLAPAPASRPLLDRGRAALGRLTGDPIPPPPR